MTRFRASNTGLNLATPYTIHTVVCPIIVQKQLLGYSFFLCLCVGGFICAVGFVIVPPPVLVPREGCVS